MVPIRPCCEAPARHSGSLGQVQGSPDCREGFSQPKLEKAPVLSKKLACSPSPPRANSDRRSSSLFRRPLSSLSGGFHLSNKEQDLNSFLAIQRLFRHSSLLYRSHNLLKSALGLHQVELPWHSHERISLQNSMDQQLFDKWMRPSCRSQNTSEQAWWWRNKNNARSIVFKRPLNCDALARPNNSKPNADSDVEQAEPLLVQVPAP